jgi:predicted phosphodiesterase
MRFLHTADWQMGMRAAHAGAAGKAVREARLQALRRVVESAREHGAEFILVAGDCFENNGVERVLVQQVADILGAFPGPVFLIPGNHDPCVPGSVWEHPAWRSHRNLHVFTRPEPVEQPWGTLFPCPVREKHSLNDPTRWIESEAAAGKGIRIGLAHGTVEGVQVEEPDYPIARQAAARARLDYLALGHWHSFAPYPDAAGAVRMAYSGTHETSKFGERDSGNALLVEIAAPGAAPVITPLRMGTLRWEVFDEEVSQPGELARVRERVEAIADPQTFLADVRLRGLLAPEEGAELARLTELLAARFLHARLDAAALHPRPGDTHWIEALPPGPVRDAAAHLQRFADPHWHGSRPEGVTSETAMQSLLLLYQIAAEEGMGMEPQETIPANPAPPNQEQAARIPLASSASASHPGGNGQGDAQPLLVPSS